MPQKMHLTTGVETQAGAPQAPITHYTPVTTSTNTLIARLVERIQKSLSEVRKRIKEVEQELQRLQSERANYEKLAENCRRRLSEYEAQIKRVEDRISRLSVELAELRARERLLEEQLEALTRENRIVVAPGKGHGRIQPVPTPPAWGARA